MVDDESKSLIRRYWLELGFYQKNSFFLNDLDDLESYLSTINIYLETEEQKRLDQLHDETKHLCDSSRSEAFAEYYPYEWEQIFAVHLRRSVIVTIMSMLEDHLNTACSCVAIMVETPFSNNGRKGSIIEHAKKFLAEFGKFKNPKGHEWKAIIDIYKLRNVIVHSNGKLDDEKNNDRIIKFINASPGISVSSSGAIVITPDFCFFVLKNIRDFIDKLHREQDVIRRNILQQLV